MLYTLILPTMSRIGKIPVVLPQNVQVTLFKKNHTITIQGPKGELSQTIHPDVKVDIQESNITLSIPTAQKRHKMLHGLYRSLIQNMVVGVTQGYKKTLELIGIGYKAKIENNTIQMELGYSHKVSFVMPPPVIATTEITSKKIPTIYLESIDKQLLGQVAAKIYDLRKPNPYTGKGIRFLGQEILRKAAKTTK